VPGYSILGTRLRPLPDSFCPAWAVSFMNRELKGLAYFIRERKMSYDADPRVRFCDEYEKLMDEFVRALSAWTQMHCFQDDPSPSDIPSHQLPASLAHTHRSSGNLAKAELARSSGSYIAAMWALRMHSRACLLCQETLRVQVNGNAAPPARFSPSCC